MWILSLFYWMVRAPPADPMAASVGAVPFNWKKIVPFPVVANARCPVVPATTGVAVA
jgi:hypothetical protein